MLHEKIKATDVKALAADLKGMTSAELKELKTALGMKGSGSKDSISEKLIDQVKQPHAGMAKEHIEHLKAKGGEDAHEKLSGFLGRMTDADLEKVAKEHGLNTDEYLYEPEEVAKHILKKPEAKKEPEPKEEPKPAAAPDTEKHAKKIEDAFDKLNREGGGYNHVALHKLQKESGLGKPEFEAAVKTLRQEGGYTASAFEGRHGITPEEKAGLIQDGTDTTGLPQYLGFLHRRPQAKPAAPAKTEPAKPAKAEPLKTAAPKGDTASLGSKVTEMYNSAGKAGKNKHADINAAFEALKATKPSKPTLAGIARKLNIPESAITLKSIDKLIESMRMAVIDRQGASDRVLV